MGMLSCASGCRGIDYAKIFLDTAKESLTDENYALDYGYALYYYHISTTSAQMRGMYEALSTQYHQKALDDITKFKFSDEAQEQKSMLLDTYKEMTKNDELSNNYPAMIVDASQIISLDTSDIDYYNYAAIGHNGLKNWNEAADYSNKSIAIKDNATARYNRGFAYFNLHQFDKAEEDLKKAPLVYQDHIATEKPSILEYNIASRLAAVYSAKGDLRKQLDVFNTSPILFSSKDNTPKILSQNYGWRCYLHEQLGEYEAALEDCNKSLTMGPMNFFAAQEKPKLIAKLKQAAVK
jgi:tetratricopeptide (TPR) repeat protein